MSSLRDLDAAATPGPWMAGRDGAVVGDAHVAAQTGDMVVDVYAHDEGRMHADAALIAEMRNRLPLYLALEDEARIALLLLADFGRVVKWHDAGRDLGEPAAAIRLRQCLTALDEAAK